MYNKITEENDLKIFTGLMDLYNYVGAGKIASESGLTWGFENCNESHANDFFDTDPHYMALSWLGKKESSQADIEQTIISQNWPLGYKKIKKLVSTVKAPEFTSIKRKIIRGDYGSELDPIKVFSGSLNNAWRRREKRKVSAQMTSPTILVNVSITSGQNSSCIFWRMAAGLALAQGLQDAGYSPSIVAMRYTANAELGGGARRHCSFVPIKTAQESLNLRKASVFGLGGFTRVMLFKAMLRSEAHIESGMGQAIREYPESMVRELSGRLPIDFKNIFCVPCHVESGEYAARDWVNSQSLRVFDLTDTSGKVALYQD